MVVPLKRLQTLVRLEVPQLDRHVGRTRHQKLALSVKGDVLHGVSVSLERPLVVTGFKVPDLDRGVLRGRDQEREDRVEEDFGDGRPVAGQGVLLGRARDPLGGRPLFAGWSARYELFLCLTQLDFKLVDLEKN